jgi:hypothetical protein
MFDGLITIAGGLLAASALIVARKPNAKDLIDKLTPYQGWIGLVLFVWGIWDTLFIVRNVGALTHFPLLMLFGIAITVTDLVVGFLLGFGLVTKYALNRSPAALARGQQIRAKLATYQGAFGLGAIVLGATYIVLTV